jgi:hypothetical protein
VRAWGIEDEAVDNWLLLLIIVDSYFKGVTVIVMEIVMEMKTVVVTKR